jgi:hypothetical protein
MRKSVFNLPFWPISSSNSYLPSCHPLIHPEKTCINTPGFDTEPWSQDARILGSTFAKVGKIASIGNSALGTLHKSICYFIFFVVHTHIITLSISRAKLVWVEVWSVCSSKCLRLTFSFKCSIKCLRYTKITENIREVTENGHQTSKDLQVFVTALKNLNVPIGNQKVT